MQHAIGITVECILLEVVWFWLVVGVFVFVWVGVFVGFVLLLLLFLSKDNVNTIIASP